MKNYHDILFPYAYNILGSSEDAKDTIQDILIKYLSIDKSSVENEIGYLVRSVINHAINLKKRRSKITRMNEVWLPEPFSTENTDDSIHKEEILSYSMLVLLEKLTVKERAVFILKEAFDYSHKEIAEVLSFSIENSRKLLSRAKEKVQNTQINENRNMVYDTYPLENYVKVIQSGDLIALENLLSNDIVVAADGGKDIKVVRALTTGITTASKLLIYVYKAFLAGLTIKMKYVNHQPAILFFQNGTLYNCQVFELEGTKIKSIYSIVDPKKLKSFLL